MRGSNINWKNKSASTKCAMEHKSERPNRNRRTLISFLTAKDRLPCCEQKQQPPPLELKRQNTSVSKEEYSPERLDPQKKKKQKVLTQNVQIFEAESMIYDEKKLQRVLHDSLNLVASTEKPLRDQFKCSHYLRIERERDTATELEESKLNKYRESGELGRIYARKEQAKK